MNYNYLSKIATVLQQHTNKNDLINSLSNTQFVSKRWLIDVLAAQKLPLSPRVLILGAWYGSYLVPMLDDTIKPSHIILNDKDPVVLHYAQMLHGVEKYTYHAFDADNFADYVDQYDVDVVINTSCEHMKDMTNLKVNNSDCVYVFQSCDNDNDPGHINTVQSTDQFIEKTGIVEVNFKGRLDLGHKNRFMVVGCK